MRKAEIRVEREDVFFERGRRLAKAADQGDAIPPSRVVAFEDVESPPPCPNGEAGASSQAGPPDTNIDQRAGEETEARSERRNPRCPGSGAFRSDSSH